jgi:hypothetical protein
MTCSSLPVLQHLYYYTTCWLLCSISMPILYDSPTFSYTFLIHVHYQCYNYMIASHPLPFRTLNALYMTGGVSHRGNDQFLIRWDLVNSDPPKKLNIETCLELEHGFATYSRIYFNKQNYLHVIEMFNTRRLPLHHPMGTFQAYFS